MGRLADSIMLVLETHLKKPFSGDELFFMLEGKQVVYLVEKEIFIFKEPVSEEVHDEIHKFFNLLAEKKGGIKKMWNTCVNCGEITRYLNPKNLCITCETELEEIEEE